MSVDSLIQRLEGFLTHRAPGLPFGRAARLRQDDFKVRIPLRIKITVPYLILAVVLAMSAAYLVTQVVFDTVDTRFTNQLIASGKRVSAAMVGQEEKLLRSFRLLAHTDGLAEALQKAHPDPDLIRSLALGIMLEQGEEVVEFLNAQGDLALACRRQINSKIEDYTCAISSQVDYSAWDFVARVLTAETDAYGDKFSGRVNVSGEDYFYVAGPVIDLQDERVGVILVGKRLESLVKEIQEGTLTDVTLYDFTGQPITSSFTQAASLEASTTAKVLEFQSGSSVRRNLSSSRRELEVSNVPYDEILGAWEGRGKVDLGVLGVALPEDFLVQASGATRIQITTLVAVAFILIILVGVKIANLITRPLTDLVQASARVAHGDLSVLVKPDGFDEVAVLAQSFNWMVANLDRSKKQLLETYDHTLEGWSMALELRDRETKGHTKRVAEMTVMLAREMGVQEESLADIRRGALLHDMGKLGIPDAILHKKGALDAQEWEAMRKHPETAHQMLWPIEFLRPALVIPYGHHERWDGSGYPLGLVGEDIPLAARIFAVVDVWDALRSNRPYRRALPESQVLMYLRENSGILFDPQVVEAFWKLIGQPAIRKISHLQRTQDVV